MRYWAQSNKLKLREITVESTMNIIRFSILPNWRLYTIPLRKLSKSSKYKSLKTRQLRCWFWYKIVLLLGTLDTHMWFKLPVALRNPFAISLTLLAFASRQKSIDTKWVQVFTPLQCGSDSYLLTILEKESLFIKLKNWKIYLHLQWAWSCFAWTPKINLREKL